MPHVPFLEENFRGSIHGPTLFCPVTFNLWHSGDTKLTSTSLPTIQCIPLQSQGPRRVRRRFSCISRNPSHQSPSTMASAPWDRIPSENTLFVLVTGGNRYVQLLLAPIPI